LTCRARRLFNKDAQVCGLSVDRVTDGLSHELQGIGKVGDDLAVCVRSS
jgi:hypothetical protein